LYCQIKCNMDSFIAKCYLKGSLNLKEKVILDT